MYGQDTARAGIWTVAGPVLIARVVGSALTILVLSLVSPFVRGGAPGLSVVVASTSLSTRTGVLVLIVGSILSGVVLCVALRHVAGLEISFGSAALVFAVGSCVSILVLWFLGGRATAQGISPLTGFAPLISIAILVLEAMLANGLSYPVSSPAPRTTGGSASFLGVGLVALIVLALVSAFGHLHLSSGAAAASHVPLVEQQMSDNIRRWDEGLTHPKTLQAMSCKPADGPPVGVGRDAIYTYFSCVATYTSGQKQGWCAAFDGHIIGTYFEGRQGCNGPADPKIRP